MYGKIYCHLHQNNRFPQYNVPVGEVESDKFAGKFIMI